MGRLINASTRQVLAERAECAFGGWSLLRGLMGRAVPLGYALGLRGCDWVHTAFVRAPLDILFCGPKGDVMRVYLDVPPFRLLPRVRGAAIAWETASGGFGPVRVSPGDVVIFE